MAISAGLPLPTGHTVGPTLRHHARPIHLRATEVEACAVVAEAIAPTLLVPIHVVLAQHRAAPAIGPVPRQAPTAPLHVVHGRRAVVAAARSLAAEVAQVAALAQVAPSVAAAVAQVAPSAEAVEVVDIISANF